MQAKRGNDPIEAFCERGDGAPILFARAINDAGFQTERRQFRNDLFDTIREAFVLQMIVRVVEGDHLGRCSRANSWMLSTSRERPVRRLGVSCCQSPACRNGARSAFKISSARKSLNRSQITVARPLTIAESLSARK